MTTWKKVLAALCSLFCLVHGRFSTDNYSQGSKKPLPVILMHKQALGNDGTFNYAFAADNGLQQGESINPDGSRTGAYSYVDPDGQKISVKYTAGRDGFQILEGDHIPKAAIAVAHTPQRPSIYSASPYNSNRYSSSGESFDFNDIAGGSSGSGSSNYNKYNSGPATAYTQYRNKVNPSFRPPVYRVYEEGSSAEHHPQYVLSPKASSVGGSGSLTGSGYRELEQQEHNFGGGYSFEFGGAANQP